MPDFDSGASFPTPGLGWLAAPDERTPGFFPAFARVSVAIQTVLRDRIPGHYFIDSQAFANPKIAYPMLVYRSSSPFRGKMRTELTYDVLNPKTLASFFRTVRPVFSDVLQTVKSRLLDENLPQIAALYEPHRAQAILESVQRLSKSRKCLYVLIRAESVLITTMFDLAGLGNLPIKQQARRIASFERKWRYQLRRMYPGTDYTWLAAELMEAATEALAETDTPEPDFPPQPDPELLDEP